ncbi:HD-GYP domain-containing protein [Cohnella thailandensis]|uniref:HD domain-containing protein n=1 Tax=Cohnella thailandensis TaxID=557557 RepID=A0A841T2Y4_9BACL|nr:HD domain-containing phosphohydrolase [Cohnella thailandensis]MBB6637972.1 HD domain-containing protein [Cohnella thailandensis]MBP1976889.1 HD-GYP domain-containing protein (c-di-GMP phosphodiesterase class II) [Cohnella thailandensis]
MRLVDIESVEPGQVLGRTIFSANGTVLLTTGVQLTVFMISTLKRVGVTMIYIDDPMFRDISIEEVLSESTKGAVIQQMSESFDALRSGKSFNTKAISMTVDALLEDVLKNQNVLVQLSDIRTEDNAIYIHSMNVCMMATLVGVNMGLNMIQLKELAMGALLHDIGKVGAPELQEGRSHHSWRGFEMLKMKREYSLLISHVAFQHHEAVDGSGKPRGIRGDEIHLYAKITAIANIYDNMLTDLSEGKRILPHEAVERLNAMSGTVVDRDVLIEFLRIVSVYPNGISVRLSNRQTGVVVGQHKGLPGRPIVRVIDKAGDEAVGASEVDLAQRTTIFIESVLS